MNQAENRIPTNLRTLKILEVLGNCGEPMTATQINRYLDLPKQTIHRLCATLEEEGYLVRELNGKRYQPASRTKSIASGILYNSTNELLIRQVMEGIAGETRETVNLAIPGDKGMMYLKRVETDWPFRIQFSEGANVPFYCTASGKTFLSNLPHARRQALVGRLQFEKRTDNTLTSASVLLDELSVISRRGYALDNEEFIEGMVAIAVPVLDANSKYCASLAVHGPVQRMSLEKAQGFHECLVDAAKALQGELFA